PHREARADRSPAPPAVACRARPPGESGLARRVGLRRAPGRARVARERAGRNAMSQARDAAPPGRRRPRSQQVTRSPVQIAPAIALAHYRLEILLEGDAVAHWILDDRANQPGGHVRRA